jgi:hypothetical protein
MNSWDCFDTLVARKYFHPQTVFQAVGQKLGMSDFVQRRVLAEKQSNGTFQNIYERLPGIDPNIEFETELEHCFPIVENMQKVKDGDIIVSDMYLNSIQVAQILKRCGLDKDVKVYVTPGGKHTGTIWKHLGKIDFHTGDNVHSDVNSPRRVGINAIHYTESNFNDVEKFVLGQNPELACWMRYIRLSCPYNGDLKKFWWEQSSLNMPVLALISFLLPDKPIVFNMRDCVHLQRIYEKITGKLSSSVVSSRKCLYNPSSHFANYFIDSTKDKVIVDLQGTSRSLKTFFKSQNTSMPETIYVCGPVEFPTVGLTSVRSDAIERFNFSGEGTLIGWDESGPIKSACEHPKDVVKLQEEVMNVTIDTYDKFNIKSQQNDKDLLSNLLAFMAISHTNRVVPFTTNHA